MDLTARQVGTSPVFPFNSNNMTATGLKTEYFCSPIKPDGKTVLCCSYLQNSDMIWKEHILSVQKLHLIKYILLSQ